MATLIVIILTVITNAQLDIVLLESILGPFSLLSCSDIFVLSVFLFSCKITLKYTIAPTQDCKT